MHYSRSLKMRAVHMLAATYKDCDGFKDLLFCSDNGHAVISLEDKPNIDIDLTEDLTVFESIAKINNEMLTALADFPSEDCDSYEELEKWMEDEFNELHIFEEISPGIWHVSATSYNGEPHDHHYREGIDNYIKVNESTLATPQIINT